MGNTYVLVNKENMTRKGKRPTRPHELSDEYKSAKSIAQWLGLKYGMAYTTFRNKPKARRDQLREEYTRDTGRIVEELQEPPIYDEDFDVCDGMF